MRTTRHIRLIAGPGSFFGLWTVAVAQEFSIKPLAEIHAMHRKKVALAEPLEVRGIRDLRRQ